MLTHMQKTNQTQKNVVEFLNNDTEFVYSLSHLATVSNINENCHSIKASISASCKAQNESCVLSNEKLHL